jgi:glycosyltransferase involved in cell wall biosynthesis
MASECPALAMPLNDSEVTYVVAKAQRGVVVEPNNLQELSRQVLLLHDYVTQQHERGQRGRAELETRYSRERCVSEFERMLKQAKR